MYVISIPITVPNPRIVNSALTYGSNYRTKICEKHIIFNL